MFSELRRFRLADERRRVAQLRDLAVDLSARDYPPVTRLFYRGQGKQQSELAWEAVTSFDVRRRRIVVNDLTAGRPAPPGALLRSVLLNRDIMDALVLDLANR